MERKRYIKLFNNRIKRQWKDFDKMRKGPYFNNVGIVEHLLRFLWKTFILMHSNDQKLKIHWCPEWLKRAIKEVEYVAPFFPIMWWVRVCVWVWMTGVGSNKIVIVIRPLKQEGHWRKILNVFRPTTPSGKLNGWSCLANSSQHYLCCRCATGVLELLQMPYFFPQM